MKVRFDTDTFLRQMEAYAERKEAQIQAGLTNGCIEVQKKPWINAPRIPPPCARASHTR